MKRVLIVDDNEKLVSSLWSMLSLDYDVALAYSGFEFSRIKNIGRCFDHILIDYRMPGLNGIEAIKQTEPCSNENITIITACEDFKVREGVLELRNLGYNITGVVKKPFYYATICEEIEG